jgi:hypothetical protein
MGTHGYSTHMQGVAQGEKTNDQKLSTLVSFMEDGIALFGCRKSALGDYCAR